MVTQASRRAFLTIRRLPTSPWEQFCTRLSRSCVGQVRWNKDQPAGQAWLEPGRERDVLHAQALCREFGVRLLLLGSDACALPEQAVLWVDSRASWAQLEQIDPARQLWRVDAGVALERLREQGVGVFAAMNTDLPLSGTLAQWFASATMSPPVSNNLAGAGIVQAQLLLADGTVEQLGPFGATATAPLKSLAVQRMIPKIFELAQSEQAAACGRAEVWPRRYRLDAMMPQFGDSPNLACLFKGHGGSLAWLQTLWLAPPTLTTAQGGRDLPVAIPFEAAVLPESGTLDQAIKNTFDPTGLFGEIPGTLALESE